MLIGSLGNIKGGYLVRVVYTGKFFSVHTRVESIMWAQLIGLHCNVRFLSPGSPLYH